MIHVDLTVIYSCGCYARISPQQQFANSIKEDAFCQKHNLTVQVIEASPMYCIRCENCRHRRYYGQSEMTAKVYAAKHAIKAKHRVTILKGDEIVHVVGQDNDQLVLGDDPPF